MPYSSQLFGRSRELDLLDHFVKNYSNSKERLLLLKGPVGIGKTTLINEFLLYSSADNYLFTSVAYNGHEPKLPFGAILEIVTNAFDLLAKNCFVAFKSGLHYLNSSLTEEELADFCTVFPRLKVYFNYINPHINLLNNDNVSRIISVLLNIIIKVLNEANRKMIFFLDDLHGMDVLTTKFLEKWLSRSINGSIIWIGAVVDDIEVSDFWAKESHELSPIEVLELEGLKDDSISAYLDVNFPLSKTRQKSFVQIIRQLTGGNPLEIKLLLPALVDVGVLYFDHDAEVWEYNIEEIQKIDRSNKILNYLLGKMDEMDQADQFVISSAAVIGLKFNAAVLIVITKMERDELETVLKECVDRLIIERVPEKEGGLNHSYRFLNWQIREAAYNRLTDEKKKRIHLTYLSSLGYAAKERNIYDILDQFNQCLSYFNSEKDRLELVEMNLQAGKKAMYEEVFERAQFYFTQAIKLIESHRQIWNSDLVFEVYILSGEVAFLKSDYVSTVMFFESALKYTTNNLQKAQVHHHFLIMHNSVRDTEEAWKSGLEVLSLLDSPFPSHFSKLKKNGYVLSLNWLIRKKRFSKLSTWQLLEDPKEELVISTYMQLIQSAHLGKELASVFILLNTAKILSKERITPTAAFVFIGLAVTSRVHFKQVKKSLYFLGLVDDLMERFPTAQNRARILLDTNNFYNYYITHITNCREQLINVFDLAVASRDQSTASDTTLAMVKLLFFEGLPIQQARAIIESYSPFINRSGNKDCKKSINGILELLVMLSGEESVQSNETVLRREDINELNIEVKYDLLVSTLLAALILNETKEAGVILDRVKALNYRSYSIFYYLELIGELLFLASELKQTSSKAKKMKRIAFIQDEFESLATENPANFIFPFLLSKGVTAEINGRLNEALLEYRSAIAAASIFRFLHFNAITHERIAVVLFKINKIQEFHGELKLAQNCYESYGAFSKVKLIDKQFNIPIK